MALTSLIEALPKAELHLHIEGTLEPELMFELAVRNGVEIPYKSVDEVRAAYKFTNLQTFLDVYYAGASVLITAKDFEDLAFAYAARAHENNIKVAEIFFDPQTHTARGIAFETVLTGLEAGLARGREAFGLRSSLILCFLRHLTEEDALETIKQATPFAARIAGVGLDSSEVGHPPEKFVRAYEAARALGWRPVAHAGEEGPASFITGALDCLCAQRIDHGIAAYRDAAVLERVVRDKIPLTTCPLSNIALRVAKDETEVLALPLLRAGAMVTINSDDPAYFGGYLNANYRVLLALGATAEELAELAENSFRATWLPDDEKAAMVAEVRAALKKWKGE